MKKYKCCQDIPLPYQSKLFILSFIQARIYSPKKKSLGEECCYKLMIQQAVTPDMRFLQGLNIHHYRVYNDSKSSWEVSYELSISLYSAHTPVSCRMNKKDASWQVRPEIGMEADLLEEEGKRFSRDAIIKAHHVVMSILVIHAKKYILLHVL